MILVKSYKCALNEWWVTAWRLSISWEGNDFRWTVRMHALWDEADRVHLVKSQNASCFCCASCFISVASYWGSSPAVSPVCEQASSTGKPLLSAATWHGSLTYSEKAAGCLIYLFFIYIIWHKSCPMSSKLFIKHLFLIIFHMKSLTLLQYILSREMRQGKWLELKRGSCQSK